jgi:hypothetical protein
MLGQHVYLHSCGCEDKGPGLEVRGLCGQLVQQRVLETRRVDKHHISIGPGNDCGVSMRKGNHDELLPMKGLLLRDHAVPLGQALLIHTQVKPSE